MKNTRKGASSPGRRVGHLASTVSVTGFSVAQTGKSVALTVGTKCGFGPAERVFGFCLRGGVCQYLWPRDSRFQTSVQCHTTTILFGDDYHNNKNNLLCCISCICCRLIKTRQPKQQEQHSLLYKLFKLSSNKNTTTKTTETTLMVV